MYLDRKLSGNNILNYFALSAAADNLVGRIFGTIARNVRRGGRLVRLYYRYLPTKCTYGTKQK